MDIVDAFDQVQRENEIVSRTEVDVDGLKRLLKSMIATFTEVEAMLEALQQDVHRLHCRLVELEHD